MKKGLIEKKYDYLDFPIDGEIRENVDFEKENIEAAFCDELESNWQDSKMNYEAEISRYQRRIKHTTDDLIADAKDYWLDSRQIELGDRFWYQKREIWVDLVGIDVIYWEDFGGLMYYPRFMITRKDGQIGKRPIDIPKVNELHREWDEFSPRTINRLKYLGF